jgi:hypothetical protein
VKSDSRSNEKCRLWTGTVVRSTLAVAYPLLYVNRGENDDCRANLSSGFSPGNINKAECWRNGHGEKSVSFWR